MPPDSPAPAPPPPSPAAPAAAPRTRHRRPDAAQITGLAIVGFSLLLLIRWLGSLDPAWLAAPDGFNPWQLPVPASAWGLSDPGRTLFAPLAVTGALALLLRGLPRRPWSQGLALALLLTFALRYLIWRTTTLGSGWSLAWLITVPMLVTEVLYLVHHLFPFGPALLFDSNHRRRQADQLMAQPLAEALGVEVWIAVEEEPERLVRRALISSLSLEPQPAKVVLIDLTDRPELARLAETLGVTLCRPAAGEERAALLNRLLRAEGAALIAMFDGNFMPLRPFLRRTLGFFGEPRVAMVQTPQSHFQSEFWNRNLGVDLVMPGNRDAFFHYQEVIRDRCNAVLGCGTSWVARRSALLEAGGFLGSAGRMEDQQTSTRLLTRGWRIVYLDEMLSLGEAPKTFNSYLQERLRATQGDIQTLLMPRQLPIWRSLGPWARGFYLDQALGLLTPLLRTLYLVLPLLALMLGEPLIDAPLITTAAYALPFLILFHTVPAWLSDQHLIPFWQEIHETLAAFPTLARLPRLLRQPFRPLPAQADAPPQHRLGQSLNLRLAWPFLILLLLLIGTLLINYSPALLPGSTEMPTPPYRGESINLIWNLYNGWVLLICLLCCIDQPVRQGGDRLPLRRSCRLEIGGRSLSGHTGDLSETGASFHSEAGSQPPPGGDGWLELQQPPLRLPVRLVRREGELAGLLFQPMDSATTVALLELLYGGEVMLPRTRTPGMLTALRSLIEGLWEAEPILRRY